jgi:hypothetical protein
VYNWEVIEIGNGIDGVWSEEKYSHYFLFDKYYTIYEHCFRNYCRLFCGIPRQVSSQAER